MNRRIARAALIVVGGAVLPLEASLVLAGGSSALAAAQPEVVVTAAATTDAATVELAAAEPAVLEAQAPTTVVTAAPAPAPAPPPPPPPVPAPSPPAPVAPPAPEGTGGDRMVRIQEAFATSVPEVWRNAIPVTFGIIDGRTSWARSDGAIEIGTYHTDGSWSHLLITVAHEFGHQVAYTYGTWEYLGAAPARWPYAGPEPAEAWADCVALAFTGIVDPSHGLAPCPADSLHWTAAWLAAGPPA